CRDKVRREAENRRRIKIQVRLRFQEKRQVVRIGFQESQQEVDMYEVTVEDSFAAGHYLRNYRGKCENPHGHNYKVRITLQGRELDHAGLLLDFKELKLAMKPVIDRLDHRMINDVVPFTTLNPSAENLAKFFFDETNVTLRSSTSGRVSVKE